MSLTVEDLRPKPFKVKVQGVELESKPIRLSHALIIARVGNSFQDSSLSKEKLKQAEADMDEVLTELIPELKGIELDLPTTTELIEQLMEHIEPSESKELKDKGVSFGDPKVPKTT